MDCVKIGQFIAERRREPGYTQNAVAERLGISDKAVSYKSEIVLQRHRSGMLYYIILYYITPVSFDYFEF